MNPQVRSTLVVEYLAIHMAREINRKVVKEMRENLVSNSRDTSNCCSKISKRAQQALPEPGAQQAEVSGIKGARPATGARSLPMDLPT